MRQIGEVIAGRPLYHAETHETVRDVARRMAAWNVGAIAILEAGKLAGVFSERDLMARVVAAGLDPEVTTVGSVMTRELMVGDPSEEVASALAKMHSLNCRHLPVVQGGSLVGMISLRDLMQIDGDTTRQRANFLSELVTLSPDYET
jgi:signal-transduction protein with cAMP-binding, CBS, and nucleotidyltransferase domain